MSKYKMTLPMKGLYAPRFLIWGYGFFHGKIMHTGGVDPETNLLSSSYITGQMKRFRNACIIRREEAEVKLAEAWSKADQLIIDFTIVCSALADFTGIQKVHGASNAVVRANEKTEKEKAVYEIKRQTILKDLANISNEIRKEIDSVYDQMEATAETLLSTFSCYGHGLLMKPVYTHNLPVIVYEDCAKQILHNHKDTWEGICSILKGVTV